MLIVQGLTIAAAFFLVFLALFALRDILLRTHSFVYQILCIVMVAALPVVGFLLYLLIRPRRTLSEKRIERKLDELVHALHQRKQEKAQKGQK